MSLFDGKNSVAGQDMHPVFIVNKNFDSPLARLYSTVLDNDHPFCLTEFDGFPLLQHTIYSLLLFGHESFTIITVPEYYCALE